ncbi:MAG: radical SAM protein, partial [Coprothermobacterota bacterium]|nr:radical SAM protein [Coprothermobacterota bacterium]
MKDPFGRTIDYLRLSVTDRCNLRCFYCMPEEGVSPLSHSDILRYEEMAIVVEQAVQEGIRNVRLTGGEPLVRKGVPELIQQLRGIDGLQDLSLTTNAVLLPLYAQPLWQAGLRRINIGLPSLDRQVYARLTRHD